MAVYTPKTLATQAALTTSAATIYTAPGATTGVIRTIQVQCPSAAHNFTLSIGTDAVGTRIFDTYALTANVPSQFNGWWTVSTGVVVQAKADNTAVTLGLYGMEFA